MREKYQLVASCVCPVLGIKSAWIRDQTCNLDVCPDQESNPQPFGYRMMLQPSEPHWIGLGFVLFYSFLKKKMFVYLSGEGREKERKRNIGVIE